MPTFKKPKTFVIAATQLNDEILGDALVDLGVPNWDPDSTNDADILTEFAGKLCYMSFDTSLNDNLTKVGGRSNHDYIQGGIIAKHHGSVLEHSTVSILIRDVSRIVTHELARHRAGTAFSQTSGRYVRTAELEAYIPKCIEENPEAVAIFERAFASMEQSIQALCDIYAIDDQNFARKKELTSAFRRIAGFGHLSNIVVTANHRAWRHMIEMRTDPGAEEEIRVVFAEISMQLREMYPTIYADAIITVEDGIEVTKFEHSKV